MKYLVATLAGFGIFCLYVLVAVCMDWSHGGGSVVQVCLWGGIATVWTVIVKKWEAKTTPVGKEQSQSGTGVPATLSGPIESQVPMPSVVISETALPVDKENQALPVDKENQALPADKENQAYAEAWSECEEGRQDKGLWARAFVEADGDEKKAKVRYLKLRVGILCRDGHSLSKSRLVSVAVVGQVPLVTIPQLSLFRECELTYAEHTQGGMGGVDGGAQGTSTRKYRTVAAFLEEYRVQNPQFKDNSDDTLYSIAVKGCPDVRSQIKDAPAPKYTDWPTLVAGYKERRPEYRSVPDIDLANQLRNELPVLKVFDAPGLYWYR